MGTYRYEWSTIRLESAGFLVGIESGDWLIRLVFVLVRVYRFAFEGSKFKAFSRIFVLR